MEYKYWMQVTRPGSDQYDYIKSDSLYFLIGLGEDGLRNGMYTSATIKEMSDVG